MIDSKTANFKFSLYENLYSVDHPKMVIDINQLYEIIRNGSIKNEINHLRQLTDKKEYDKFKRSSLPAVTLSGIFEHRSSSGFIMHSGLMQIDIDNVGDDYEKYFNNMCDDSFTYLAFKSPRGNGIKAIVKVYPSIDTHASQFLALERHYQIEHHIGIDPSCKDIARCMLLSFDPNIYCNPNSKLFTDSFEYPKHQEYPHAVFENNFNANEDLIDYITSKLVQLKIDITSPYENWIKIGFSLAETLGEGGRGYFNQISSVDKGYSQKECDRLYSGLLKKNIGKVNLGTLIYLAREAGVDY